MKDKVIKIGSKKTKPSGLSEIKLLKIRVIKIEETLNRLLENSGLDIISIDESPEDKKLRSEHEKSTVRYGN